MNISAKSFIKICTLVIVLAGILYANNSSARPVRLTYSGGFIQLNITSLEHYNNGIELPNWTRLKIAIDTTGYNLPVTYTGWRLYIWSADPAIQSDDGNDPLDLALLTMQPVGFSASPDTEYTFPNSTTPYTLSNSEKVFIEGTKLNGFEATFGLTYEFGKTSPLLDSPWGFYYTQLYFKLELY
ncbi:MAG: hypothetical protein RBR68_12795 [Tenuifilaceae bacterium]|nr:hypothetical protein [Tenuifilaceae bacterium]